MQNIGDDTAVVFFHLDDPAATPAGTPLVNAIDRGLMWANNDTALLKVSQSVRRETIARRETLPAWRWLGICWHIGKISVSGDRRLPPAGCACRGPPKRWYSEDRATASSRRAGYTSHVTRKTFDTITARCRCGQVRFEADGPPITALVCYCDDCQEGARRIEALPGAGKVLDPAGGTALVLWRKDRVRCLQGEALLQGSRIRQKTKTERMVASCCNSFLLVRFDDSRPWVSIFRARIEGDAPPPEMRIMTKFMPASAELPDDLRSYRTFPLRLPVKLVGAQLARWLGR